MYDVYSRKSFGIVHAEGNLFDEASLFSSETDLFVPSQAISHSRNLAGLTILDCSEDLLKLSSDCPRVEDCQTTDTAEDIIRIGSTGYRVIT